MSAYYDATDPAFIDDSVPAQDEPTFIAQTKRKEVYIFRGQIAQLSKLSICRVFHRVY